MASSRNGRRAERIPIEYRQDTEAKVAAERPSVRSIRSCEKALRGVATPFAPLAQQMRCPVASRVCGDDAG